MTTDPGLLAGVIVNTNARRVSRDPALVAALERAGGDEASVAVTHSPEQIDARLRSFAARGVSLVGSCGGDGATTAVLSAMMRVWPEAQARPPLLMLPAGTMNTVARNLGVRGEPTELLGRAMAARRAGRLRLAKPTALVINDTRYGFLFGAAFAARFIELYYERGAGVGTAVRLAFEVPAAALAGRPLARRLFERVPAALRCDGETLSSSAYSLIVASTLRDYGLGLKVTYRGSERSDRFHVVASALGPARLALGYPRGFLGRPMARSDAYHDRLAQRLEIAFEQDEPYIVDGELHRARELSVRLGPQVDVCAA